MKNIGSKALQSGVRFTITSSSNGTVLGKSVFGINGIQKSPFINRTVQVKRASAYSSALMNADKVNLQGKNLTQGRVSFASGVSVKQLTSYDNIVFKKGDEPAKQSATPITHFDIKSAILKDETLRDIMVKNEVSNASSTKTEIPTEIVQPIQAEVVTTPAVKVLQAEVEILEPVKASLAEILQSRSVETVAIKIKEQRKETFKAHLESLLRAKLEDNSGVIFPKKQNLEGIQNFAKKQYELEKANQVALEKLLVPGAIPPPPPLSSFVNNTSIQSIGEKKEPIKNSVEKLGNGVGATNSKEMNSKSVENKVLLELKDRLNKRNEDSESEV